LPALLGAQTPDQHAARGHLDDRVECKRDERRRSRRDARTDAEDGFDRHPADGQVFEAKRAAEKTLAISSKHRLEMLAALSWTVDPAAGGPRPRSSGAWRCRPRRCRRPRAAASATPA